VPENYAITGISTPASSSLRSGWIIERARELGFAMCGVVRAAKFPELARNEEWLARGFAGDMKYLGDTRRADPQQAMPGVRSVIVCALTYNTKYPRTAQAWADSGDAERQSQEPRGWISRYAWGDDYHQVLRAKLESLLESVHLHNPEPFEARIYTDTGPINERVLAKRAGLGWLGKNTLLLNERLGSFFFLGTILTTLDLEPPPRSPQFPPPDRCGSCRKCIDACPTAALVEPYVMDARKCISYLTIELRSAIPQGLREAVGQHIFGCDICQDVCPWNRNAPVTGAEEFEPRVYWQKNLQAATVEFEAADPQTEDPQAEALSSGGTSGASRQSLFMPGLEWLASLSEPEFREVFRDSPIKRTKWKGLIRNVCVALGNSKITRGSDTHLRISRLLARLAASGEPSIAESAQWAVSRIQAKDVSSDFRF
jgi:epoxyqueuosine reductase